MRGRPEKFTALTKHLKEKVEEFRDRGKTDYEMTFKDIEALGVALPPSAYKYRAWWANNKHNNWADPNRNPPEKPWERALFDTQEVDMKRGTLTFRYYGGFSDKGRAKQEERKNARNARHQLTLSDLRARRILVPPSRKSMAPKGMADVARPYSEPEEIPPGTPPRCRHPLYGALKGHIRLVAGTDLTEPADPEWGERVWGEDKT